jgi:predicted unusual protein kinase regulating ubiquinone biosynthesis (AarF/ABC1/UbiB family)
VSESAFSNKGRAVPSGRLSRLAGFGRLAGGVAGGMLVDGAKQLASGKRPSVGDLLLTPANARKVADQLANLRGAAMKMGQLMSMDAGDMLPRELTDILARLRSDAQHMPQRQLQAVLSAAWGKGWETRFITFDYRPIAAASIGQVHRGKTRDGRDLAIKVQYPGVRGSIDSDVDNVATLIKMSGLLPKSLDIAPMLVEAKRQLHEEADYEREALYLSRFAALLDDSPDFRVPALHVDYSSNTILAMDYLESAPIETLATAAQAERDRVVTLLVDLLMSELFEFGMMQTDPNFANYRYDSKTRHIILLDFGAARDILPDIAQKYRVLMKAGLSADLPAARTAMIDIGFFDDLTQQKHQDAVMAMFAMAMEPLRAPGVFDFGNNEVALALRNKGMAIAAERDFWHIPPIETLFLQRKFGGIYLLATRLKARVDVRGLMEKWV